MSLTKKNNSNKEIKMAKKLKIPMRMKKTMRMTKILTKPRKKRKSLKRRQRNRQKINQRTAGMMRILVRKLSTMEKNRFKKLHNLKLKKLKNIRKLKKLKIPMKLKTLKLWKKNLQVVQKGQLDQKKMLK